MRNIKNNLYRQNQQFKLSTLLDFYEANPQQEYTVVIHNGIIKTILASPQQLSQQSYQPSFNFNAIDAMAKKTIGVFSNIVQQMKQKKDKGQQPQTPSDQQPKKQYQFYYKCLNEGRQPRGTSTKKVKERATGIAEDNNFKFINLNTKAKEHQNQNTNYLNAQLNTKQKQIKHPQIQVKGQNKKRSCEAFVDLDFSFEEVSEQNQQSHQTSNDLKKDSKIEIRIIDMSEANSKRTMNKLQEIQAFSQTLIPTTISKEISSNKNQEQLMPIPYKPRFELRGGNLNKLNELCINTLSREDTKVEGTKKAQSRIYEQKPKESFEERDIQIDFDLDLNFI